MCVNFGLEKKLNDKKIKIELINFFINVKF